MFFGAPFEIFDPTFVYRKRIWRGIAPSACHGWLTPFFSTPSFWPRLFTPIREGQLLSFDNHQNCPRVEFALLTTAVFSALRILSLFSGLRTLCTNRHNRFRPNPFPFLCLRTLAKTMGGVPLRAPLSARSLLTAAQVYNYGRIFEAFP